MNLDDLMPIRNDVGLCAVCAHPVTVAEESAVAVAHGNQYLCHLDCLPVGWDASAGTHPKGGNNEDWSRS